ncbi:MAG: hypothetical protein KatS3mg007_1130 [Thermoanaerobaculum sp.]|nr:MAG: hypothetical protein KatS3mg007_1130 [Thermoanaerobaculum sp.]
MSELSLRKDDRILGLFPHPDDESLGAGILLQRATAVGAAVLPVFLTSGEANAWPQRVLDRKLVLTAEDQKRFGLRRQGEAREALATLGVNPDAAVFLDFPDTALTPLLLANGESALKPLRNLVRAFQPTLVLAPLLADCHPDHSATAALALALFTEAKSGSFRLLAYPTHANLASSQEVTQIAGTAAEKALKRRAIAAHRSQLVFRRRFHLKFAGAPEVFLPLTTPPRAPQVKAALEGNVLHVSFHLPLSWRSLRKPVLTVVTLQESLSGFSLRFSPRQLAPLPPQVQRCRWQREGKSLRVLVELANAPELALVKVSRPAFLYDEMGFVLADKASV